MLIHGLPVEIWYRVFEFMERDVIISSNYDLYRKLLRLSPLLRDAVYKSFRRDVMISQAARVTEGANLFRWRNITRNLYLNLGWKDVYQMFCRRKDLKFWEYTATTVLSRSSGLDILHLTRLLEFSTRHLVKRVDYCGRKSVIHSSYFFLEGDAYDEGNGEITINGDDYVEY